ncbi:MAG: VWA domain-containing protein [Desulfobacterales bacterium]|nr:VWA domain-containing protein [Desulfobacterales bacterium]
MDRLWVLLIDTSGSMKSGFSGEISPSDCPGHIEHVEFKTKIDAARELSIREIRGKKQGDVLVIGFSNDAYLIGQGNVSNSKETNEIINSIRSVNAGGETNLASAISFAKNNIQSDKYSVISILIITDGLSNIGNPFKASVQYKKKFVHSTITTILIDPTDKGKEIAEMVSDEVRFAFSSAGLKQEISRAAENADLKLDAPEAVHEAKAVHEPNAVYNLHIFIPKYLIIVIIIVSCFTLWKMISEEGKISRPEKNILPIHRYITNRFGEKAEIIDKKNYKASYIISGIKNEILQNMNKWEKIQLNVYLLNKDKFLLYIDAYYSPGLGSTEPNPSGYKDMEKEYHNELSKYITKLRYEIETCINHEIEIKPSEIHEEEVQRVKKQIETWKIRGLNAIREEGKIRGFDEIQREMIRKKLKKNFPKLQGNFLLNPKVSVVIPSIQRYIERRFDKKAELVDIDNYKISFIISGIKNEILKDMNKWEKIELDIYLININIFLLYIDAYYSPGLGSTEPKFFSYIDMEKTYHKELSIYTTKLRHEIEVYINHE